jgi:peptide/nickel transport system ATP-binding protein
MFIAHDLAVAEHISDRIAVMYAGRLVEVARTEALFVRPLHPSTEALIGTIPLPDPRLNKALRTRLGGEIANLTNPPAGCNFHPRCRCATAACLTERPPLRQLADRQLAYRHAETLELKGA